MKKVFAILFVAATVATACQKKADDAAATDSTVVAVDTTATVDTAAAAVDTTAAVADTTKK